MGGVVTKKKESSTSPRPLKPPALHKSVNNVKTPNGSSVAAVGVSGDGSNMSPLNNAPKNKTRNAKLKQKSEAKHLVSALPLSSCLVPPKYLPKKSASGGDKTRNLRLQQGGNGLLAVEISSSNNNDDNDSCNGTCWGAALSAQNAVVNPQLAECGVVNNNGGGGDGGESPKVLDETQTNKLSSNSTPFSVCSQGIDDRTTRLFLDYITQHSMGFRGPRDILWFNLDYDRSQLKRRDRPPLIVWNPIEEIALNEDDESSDEENSVLSADDENERKEIEQKTRGIGTKETPRRRSSIKSRIRPIISCDVPHRLQLATKAIEDNYLFIQARPPKFYR